MGGRIFIVTAPQCAAKEKRKAEEQKHERQSVSESEEKSPPQFFPLPKQQHHQNRERVSLYVHSQCVTL